MTDATFNVRPYPQRTERYQHMCSQEGCSNERYEKGSKALCKAHYDEYMREAQARSRQRKQGIEPPRNMTDHERTLNTFASRDGIAGMLTIWHESADGAYSGFEVILPDAGCMAVIGTIGKAGGNG